MRGLCNPMFLMLATWVEVLSIRLENNQDQCPKKHFLSFAPPFLSHTSAYFCVDCFLQASF